MSRPPRPFFTEQSAIQMVQAAEGAWNTRGPARLVLACTPAGLMAARPASINEHVIAEAERHLRWPLGRRPDDDPGLSDPGL